MGSEIDAPHTDFSFFDRSDQDFVSNLYADDLAETIAVSPEDTMYAVFELWRKRRNDAIYELGARLGEEIVWSTELEAEMTQRITKLSIQNPQLEPIFSSFVKDTMEGLQRGIKGIPEDRLEENDVLRILEYHDKLFNEVRKNRAILKSVTGLDFPLLDPSQRLN